MKIIVKKPLRYAGKPYRTGDMAHVSRQHARMLVALKRAVIAPADAATPAPTPPAPVDLMPSTSSQPEHVDPVVDTTAETAHEQVLTHSAQQATPPARAQTRFNRGDAKAKQPK